MKKCFLLTVVVLCVAFAAGAQNFGIKGGLNLYKLGGDGGDNSDMKAGIHFGGLAHIHLTKEWAFQPELIYSLQGAESEKDGDTRKLNLNYVNIPLMFQYMFDNGFRLEAGPQFGILAVARAKDGDTITDVKDSYNSLDFTVPLGVGYISDSGFGVDLRYNIGLSNVHENDDNKAYNRGLQAGVFYQFKGK